ncbi:hypothetical protein [Microbispora sp. CSR-4]|uniref:hypothetical protein n=1 Tax=Microbispora sp. CSR-4 TaxID=2592813 RepID=UPI0011C7A52D|nr:hypothetical protein [Microbispora sp. CSR-4]
MTTSAADLTITWETLVACEPRLTALDMLVTRATQGVPDGEIKWCANRFFYSAIKPFLVQLVGWERGYPPEEALDPTSAVNFLILQRSDLDALHEAEEQRRRPATTLHEELLRSSAAYDYVYDRLYGALPGCRDCLCL